MFFFPLFCWRSPGAIGNGFVSVCGGQITKLFARIHLTARARPLPSRARGLAPPLGHASRALQERPRPAAPRGLGTRREVAAADWRGPAAAHAVSSRLAPATQDVHVYVRESGIRGKRVGIPA